MGTELVEETSESRAVLLKEPHRDLLILTPSERQHQGGSMKGTNDIQGETEVPDIKTRAGEKLSPRQEGGQRPLFLF